MPPLNPLDALGDLFGKPAPEEATSAAREGHFIDDDDDLFRTTGAGLRDLTGNTLRRAQDLSVELYRKNPLANRIIKIYTTYMAGEGFALVAHNPDVQAVIDEFWDAERNDMAMNHRRFARDYLLNGEAPHPVATDETGNTTIGYIDPQRIDHVNSSPANRLILESLVIRKQGAEEVLDIFLAGPDLAPVHVFIHGGYWQSRTKDDFSFVALGLVPLGAHVVVVNYALAPAADMDEIVRQNRAALAWVWRNADSFAGDRDRLYVSGHSAGGHLVAMAMATDWPAFGDGLPGDLVNGGCAISGLYDLEPIRLSYLNEALGLDAAAAARNSPTRSPPRGSQPLIVAVGEAEPEEYQRQADEYLAAVAAAGGRGEKYVARGLNHYSIIDEFLRPDSPLAQAAARQMGPHAGGGSV